MIPRMSPGGAERVAARLGNRMVAAGYNVVLLTLGSSPDFYEMDPRVGRVRLGAMGPSGGPFGALVGNLRRHLLLRRALVAERGDVVISFLDRTNTRVLAAAIGTRVPVIITEHSYPPTSPLGPFWRLARRLLYPSAACLVSVSRGVDECFWWLAASKRAVIPNPIDEDFAKAGGLAARAVGARRHIGALGRFVEVKGFDVLIRAFARVAPLLPDWDLVVFGDGPLKRSLGQLALELSLNGRFRFPGYVVDVPAALASIDLFCLPSRSEGQGLALLEAMSLGLPVVAADCPVGPRELVNHNENGLLVPVDDVESLAAAILKIVRDDDLARRIGAAARSTAQLHSVERVFPLWQGLLQRVAADRRLV